ncbi:hypothetical protein JZU54_04120 [bacterium]|nr:hypothetical protein [bacterium]
MRLSTSPEQISEMPQRHGRQIARQQHHGLDRADVGLLAVLTDRIVGQHNDTVSRPKGDALEFAKIVGRAGAQDGFHAADLGSFRAEQVVHFSHRVVRQNHDHNVPVVVLEQIEDAENFLVPAKNEQVAALPHRAVADHAAEQHQSEQADHHREDHHRRRRPIVLTNVGGIEDVHRRPP